MSISVLMVVPHEGLRNMVRETVPPSEEADMQILVLSSGAGRIDQSIAAGKYDAVIACGCHLFLPASVGQIPVIETGISSFDMLRAILLAQFSGKNMAVVGLPDITSPAHSVMGLFQSRYDVFSLGSREETGAVLGSLKEKGYSLILGDTETAERAKALGFDSIAILPGKETITQAFSRAVELVRSTKAVHQRNDLLTHLMTDTGMSVMAFSEMDKPLFSSGEALQYPALVQRLYAQDLWGMPENEPRLLTMGDRRWLVTRKGITQDAQRVIAFSLVPFPALPVGTQKGITISTDLESEHVATETYMEHSRTMAPVLNMAKRFSKFNFPVVLIGERGVGKDTLAYIMRNYSKQKFAATIMIDSVLISEAQWMELLNDVKGILFQQNVLFYYRNFGLLSPFIQEKIVKHVTRMKTQDKSFHIISIDSDSNMQETDCLLPTVLNTLQCNTLLVPSLRARTDDIPSMITLYMNQLNYQVGSQVAVFEPGAVALMQKFSWPGNLYQFKRIITELVTMTDSSVITEANVQMALQQETNSAALSGSSMFLNTDGTLEEIEKRILHHILKEEKMNQTKAAARLGINRVTLWRKIKED